MKILHICLCATVTEGWTYQDNLLTKYHAKAGHEVSVITNEFVYNTAGQRVKSNKSFETWKYGVKIIRLPEQGTHKKMKRYVNFYETIESEEPDVIFSHACQYMDTDKVVKYMKKHVGVKLYVDNHADFSNSAMNFISKNILHKIIWRNRARKLLPYVDKFYGVMPARMSFLSELYGIPKDKIELLVMGADDEVVEKATEKNAVHCTRNKLGIQDDDFLLVTGGKIDVPKRQTLLLMQAVNEINDAHLKLVVFGSVEEELREKFDKLTSERVKYIGWISGDESYYYFAAADLAVFPGRHSVFWEQVVGLGIPAICKYWDGTTHVDVGGNVELLYEDSVDAIKNKIIGIYQDKNKYDKMKKVARTRGMKEFSYADIARRSINYCTDVIDVDGVDDL